MPSVAPPAPIKSDDLQDIGIWPCIDEHELPATPTHSAVKVDEPKLHLIAENNNRRVEETGDLTPIVIGHTKDDAPENEQPEIVGYATDFFVAPFFKTGRKALFARFLAQKDKLDKFREYPRRSVELWRGRKWYVDPISILSSSTPERDLGLLRFAKSDDDPHGTYILPDSPVRYSHEDQMADEKKKDDDKSADAPKDEPKKDDASTAADAPKAGDDAAGDPVVQKTLAALFQTDQWKKQEAVTDKLMELLESMDGGQDLDDQGEQPPPDAAAMPPAPPQQDMPAGSGQPATAPAVEAAKFNEPPPVRFDAGCASGSNTYVPTMADEKKKYERDDANTAVATPDEDVKVRLSRVEAENARKNAELADVKRQLDEAKLRYRRDNARNLLDKLEAEGFVVEKDEEFKILEVMTEEAQAKHAERVRKYYKQAPVAKPGAVDAAIDASRSAGEKRGPSNMQEVRDLAEKARVEGVSYEAALSKHYGV